MFLLESVEGWDGEGTNGMIAISCVLAFLLTKVVCKVLGGGFLGKLMNHGPQDEPAEVHSCPG